VLSEGRNREEEKKASGSLGLVPEGTSFRHKSGRGEMVRMENKIIFRSKAGENFIKSTSSIKYNFIYYRFLHE